LSRLPQSRGSSEQGDLVKGDGTIVHKRQYELVGSHRQWRAH
jgi:hypothetical protein